MKKKRLGDAMHSLLPAASTLPQSIESITVPVGRQWSVVIFNHHEDLRDTSPLKKK
jgi:hypothetical protein